jgi:hypothetical protein
MDGGEMPVFPLVSNCVWEVLPGASGEVEWLKASVPEARASERPRPSDRSRVDNARWQRLLLTQVCGESSESWTTT